MALTRSMDLGSNIARKLSKDAGISEISRLKHELSVKNTTIRSLKEKLQQSGEVNKALNASLSSLKEQLQLYLEKIDYERTKNKHRSSIYFSREKELEADIKEKTRTINKLTESERAVKDMLDARDKAIDLAYHQFEISQRKMSEELDRIRRNEKMLGETLENLQAEFFSAKQKLQEYESKGKASEELVKLFQKILEQKESVIHQEKAKLQELEFSEQELMKSVNAFQKELKAIRMAQAEEELNSLRTSMDSRLINSFC